MIAIISDTHLDKYNFDSKMGESYRETLDTLFKQIKKKYPADEENSLYLLGDVFHGTKFNKNALNWSLYLNQKFDDLGVPIHILCGNHDASNSSDDITTLAYFKFRPNINIYDGSEIVVKGNHFFLPFPFLHKYREKGKWLDKLKEATAKVKGDKIGFSHFFVNGQFASNHSGTTNRNVFFNSEDLRNSGLKELYLGDNHSPYEKEGIISVGSTFQHSFNEANEKKRFITVNNDFSNFRSFDIKMSEKRILRAKIKENIDIVDLIEKDLKKVFNKKEFKGNQISLKLELKEKQKNLYFLAEPKFKDIINSALSFSVSFDTEEEFVEDTEGILEEFLSETNQDLDKMIMNYGKKMFDNIDKESIDGILNAKRNFENGLDKQEILQEILKK